MKTLDKLALSEHDRAAIGEAAQLLRSRFSAERVILYGSKANGTDDDESDIDLLVLTSRTGWQRGAMTDALFDIDGSGVVISPLVVSAAEWEGGRFSVLPIHDVIKSSGVPV